MRRETRSSEEITETIRAQFWEQALPWPHRKWLMATLRSSRGRVWLVIGYESTAGHGEWWTVPCLVHPAFVLELGK